MPDTQRSDDWLCGFAAARQQAAELAELFATEAGGPSLEPDGVMFVDETGGADPRVLIALRIAVALCALQPSGTAIPIERITDGFRTRRDDGCAST